MSASTSSQDDPVGEVVYSRSAGVGNQAEDWDDTSLIEAYDAALGGLYDELDKRKEHVSRPKVSSTSQAASSSQTKWTEGQFCRAQYTADKQWYEAKIVAVDGGYCIVKYLGYMNHERQPLSTLKPSAGRRQRQLQIKAVETDEEGESHDEQEQAAASKESFRSEQSTSGGKASQQEQSAQQQHKRQQQQLEDLFNLGKGLRQKPASKNRQENDPGRKRGAHESSMPSPIAFPPPPPPFPPGVDEICSSDEALAAMLISWYISGYHTGYYTAVRQNSGR